MSDNNNNHSRGMSLEKGVRQTSPTVSYTKHTKNKFSSNHSSSPCPSSQKTPITSFFGRFVLCNDFCFFGLALVFRLVFSMKNSCVIRLIFGNENQRKMGSETTKIQEMTTGTSICPVVLNIGNIVLVNFQIT